VKLYVLLFGSPQQRWVRVAGEGWFTELALPQTIIALKQAFGRLMRAMDDSGVVGILDTRLVTKGYGSAILAALPPAPLVRTVFAVGTFCWRMGGRGQEGGVDGSPGNA
jgi:Rad3-related DNA helicase